MEIQLELVKFRLISVIAKQILNKRKTTEYFNIVQVLSLYILKYQVLNY